MANQYSDSFIDVLERKTKKTAQKALLEFQTQGLTYFEVANLMGYKDGTIRKWCKRYGIELIHPIIKDKNNEPSYSEIIMNSLKSKHIDVHNFLYKPWFS